MLSIFSASKHAPFNIATEEYLLRHTEHEVFLLYINRPSIIVGVHQNSIAEINLDYVKEHKIPVVRRLTGGGTVFHDLGNLNFCFIMKAAQDSPWNFERYTAPILEVLQELGVNAMLKGRNDLVIDDRKFSGNAKLVEKGKILQHGTILFDSHIGALSAALKVNPLKFNDKAVKSVRSRVTNVSEHLQQELSLQDFTSLVRAKVQSIYPEVRDYSFSDSETAQIQKLADEKYSGWEWNFGASPKYNLSRALRTPAGTLEAYLDVQEGKIESIRV
ncbi:MAG TPA: lipoate--protein ligase, partial [Candidatus Cloacimonadota bacterium]|nr:lipoate--protein ligase [Candidatus Cloacimonadota bacterium]